MAKGNPNARRRQARYVVGAKVGSDTPPTSDSNMGDPNITFIRREISEMMPKWEQVRDFLKGSFTVKAAGVKYLPMPQNDPDECERVLRYETYVERAQFYNFTSKTLQGLIGQVFSRDPILKSSSYIKKLALNIDGACTSLDQQAKVALGYVLSYGRCGLLADYPARNSNATMKEIQDLTVRPTLQCYGAWDVINWREKVIDGNTFYDLIVIQADVETSSDGFTITSDCEWKVLRIKNGVYVAETWRKDENGNTYLYSGPVMPTDANGNNLTVIPFRFVGSMTNSASVDEPPLFDLCDLNKGHYRNSADYEEACFMMGQPTLAISGLTQEWVEQVFKGAIYLGSRAAIPMPASAKAELIQVQANSMPFEAMKHKESQAVAMGAQLLRDQGVQKTFGESQNDDQSNTSYLATCAKNVSAAYTWLLPYLEGFAISSALKVVDPEADGYMFYDLNTDFPAMRMTPNERTQLIAEWMDGAITFGEMRDGLRKAGIATLDTDKAKAELEANPSPNQQKAANDLEMAKAGLAQKQAAADAKAKEPQKPNNAPNGGNQAGN